MRAYKLDQYKVVVVMAICHVIECMRRTTLESAVRRYPSHVIVVINIVALWTQLLAHNIHGKGS